MIQRCSGLLLGALLLWAGELRATEVLLPGKTSERSPFPSDRFTLPDSSQLTGLRVALPLPDCRAEPSGCDEVRLLNQLDGWSVNPRIAVSFSGPIDLGSINQESLFLLPLEASPHGPGAVIGLSQLVWDPEGKTLYGRPERLLSQRRRYGLVVTSRVLDAAGQPLRASPVIARLRQPSRSRSQGTEAPAVAGLLRLLEERGVGAEQVVALSVFTTQSVTADLEKIRVQLDQAPPPRISFEVGPGRTRSVLPWSEIVKIEFRRHAGALDGKPYTIPLGLPLSLLPASLVRAIAFGSFPSPSYLTADRVIPAVPTKSGVPRVRGLEEVHVTIILPSAPKPLAGWPVAIFGHGYGGDRHRSLLAVSATMARRGLAVAAINVVGHGGGPEGTLVVERAGKAPLLLPAGGRGVDLDGDGRIESTEGVGAPRKGAASLVSNRDGIRQTVVDLMGLIRALKAGVDLDGDGQPDLDPNGLFYFGQSFGGIYGTLLLAVDPLAGIGVLNVPGGPIVEVARLSPVFRPFVVRALRERTPQLMNGENDFDEGLPLSGNGVSRRPPPGALAIQAYLGRAEWLHQSGNPVAYAPYLKLAPLPGNAPKAVLYQLAVGDRTVPNLTTFNILRAGELFSSTSAYRHDRIVSQLPESLQNPHGFLTWTLIPSVSGIARAAQEQVARFFLSGGTGIEHPDLFDPGPYVVPVFEVPFRE